MSILSGELLSLGARTPFYLGMIGGLIALSVVAAGWRTQAMRAVVGRG